MDYFVMPPDEAHWSVSAEQLQRELQRAWPAASVQLLHQPIHSAAYKIPMQHSEIWGRMRNTGQVFTFDGDLRDAAVLAVWIRTLVPFEYPLIFCDEGYTHDILLRPETTAQDILREFEIEPSPESAP